MKNILLFLFIFLLVRVGNSQVVAAKDCIRYEISCNIITFIAITPDALINHPDTSCACSMKEILDLNKFLAAQSRTPGKISGQFDTRYAFTFYDNAGVKHVLGFSCFGDYFLDGKYYEVTTELKEEEKALKVGIFRI